MLPKLFMYFNIIDEKGYRININDNSDYDSE